MIFNWPIVGHKKILNFLQQSIERDKVSHAYLFYGPENLGKKSVAKFFSQTLICEKNAINAKDGINIKIPCGECSACLGFSKDIYPDAIWLRKEDGKKNISIDQIRDLIKKIGLTGFTKGYKIVIIVNVEEMSIEAANAFLKILEEPPKKSLIILLANNPKNLPETIISRCQLIKFSLVTKNEIKEYLEKEYNLKADQAEEISMFSLGRPGQAIKFVNDKEVFDEYLGRQKKLIEIIEGDLVERLKIVSEIYKNSEIKKIIAGWKSLVRDLILLKTKNQKLVINSRFQEELTEIVKKFSFEQLYNFEKGLDDLNSQLRQNINLRLALDNFVINL